MGLLSAIPIIGNLIDGATKLISEVITDKDKKLELQNQLKTLQIATETKILEMEHEEKLAQVDVAKIEAASNDSYVRRARPTILWVCAAGLGYSFLLHPLLCWFLKVVVIWAPVAAQITPPPNLDMTQLFPILLGMLGLSGYRTIEKIKGVVGK